MTTNQDLLDGEMGTPPPSTVDVDSIIVRQRRAGRLRQAGLIASVGVMTLAVALVLVALRPGGQSGQVGGPPSPTPSLSPREQEAARLTETLKQLLAQVLPGAEFLAPVPDDFAEISPTEPLVFVDEGDYFLAAAEIRDAEGVGTIRVTVGKEDTQLRREGKCLSDPPPGDMNVDCRTPDPLADGSKLMTSNNSSKFTGYKVYMAEILRPDDNSVAIVISNNSGPNRDVDRPTPPLTFDQTVVLAQSPELATTLP
jgi:hypothetical protein